MKLTDELATIAHLANEEEAELLRELSLVVPLTFGERLIDRMIGFASSWNFFITLLLLIVGWMLVMTQVDPFPYILLNLVLSCVATFQAPLILMSQRRKDNKDEVRANREHLVNLKAEIEIRTLHAKVDLLLNDMNKE